MVEMKRKEWIAPKGKIWVCCACGKTTKYKPEATDDDNYGWDVSCFLNSELFDVDKLERDPKTKRVVKIKE